MAYLNLGTGLAAGIVLDGRLLRGGRGVAGEIGHIPVDPAGERCGVRPARLPRDARLGLGDRAHVADVGRVARSRPVRRRRRGPRRGAIEVRDRFLTGVAAAVRLLALTTDVDRIVIGGGLAALGESLLAGTHRILNGWAAESAFLASLDLAARVQVLPLGFPAAAVGAALVGADQWQKS